MITKPNLSNQQIWNLNFGYLGLQVCFSLIIANTSRIFSGMGADTDQLAMLWLVAPLAGLLFQPVIGFLSDRTWTPYGRRIPFIFLGVVLTALVMFLMPNFNSLSGGDSSSVFLGVCFVFLIQIALNIAMQPYRSLVGDMVNREQSNAGFSIQTLLTNIGGVVGAVLPFLFAILGVQNHSDDNSSIVSTVAVSFYIGAIILLLTNLWTCFTVKEYTPKELEGFGTMRMNESSTYNHTDKKSLRNTILQLTLVQFFSWFAFYYLWVYTTDAIAFTIWNTSDSMSVSYNSAGNWFGVLTGIYSISAATFAFFIPRLARKISRTMLYSFSLALGGLSLLSMFYIVNQYLLIIPIIGIGIAWAGILTFPFAILSSFVPTNRMGVFMGLFNITIVVPQIIAGLVGGFIYKNCVGGSAIAMIVIAGSSLILGAVSVFFIKDRSQ